MNGRFKRFLGPILGVTTAISACVGLLAFQDYMNHNTKFKGTINEEKIHLYHYESIQHHRGYVQSDDNLHLLVERPDGTKILYHDDKVGEDNKKRQIERVEITKDGETIQYWPNEIGKETLDIAQGQFTQYLKDIKEYRTNRGLEGITKE